MRVWRYGVALAALSVVGCVNYESEYERSVYDFEPIYCYQTLGKVDCYRRPQSREARQLVNYYGPAPSKYHDPPRPQQTETQPPPAVSRDVRQLEPPGSEDDGGGVAARSSLAPSASQQTKSDTEDWKEWMPLMSVAFGALQVVAAFVF